MKQYITIEQVNELSNKGKEKLIQYLFPDDYFGNIMERIADVPNILSIGRMIEFLDEYRRIIELENGTGLVIDREVIIKGKVICWYKKELCDALWEAVREVLEK